MAGVDEAGRGPLAGPVVAAAVIFSPELVLAGLPPELEGLNDSKQLTPAQRDRFFAVMTSRPDIEFAVAEAGPAKIDELNILQATHAAMREAIAALALPPDQLLVDGLPVRTLPGPQLALIKGDSLSFSIAAASVLAKVTRDRAMAKIDQIYPGYGFLRHKGYPTPEHLAALRRLGPCPVHRRSFAPVNVVQIELFP